MLTLALDSGQHRPAEVELLLGRLDRGAAASPALCHVARCTTEKAPESD